MLRKGHIGITLTIISPIALAACIVFPNYTAVLIFSGALTGSNLPDIDTSTKLVKHRGFTHTFWFVGIVTIVSTIIMFVIISYIPIGRYISFTSTDHMIAALVFGASVGMGVLTHLLGDVITPTGIKPYHPVTPRNILPISMSEKKYVYEVANASDPKYNAGFSVLGVLSASISACIAGLILV